MKHWHIEEIKNIPSNFIQVKSKHIRQELYAPLVITCLHHEGNQNETQVAGEDVVWNNWTDCKLRIQSVE
jgi:hypothetical protein